MVRGFPNHRQDPVNSTTRLFPHLWYFPPWPAMNRLIFLCLALPVWCFRQSPLIFTMFIFFQEYTGTGSVNSDLTNLCHPHSFQHPSSEAKPAWPWWKYSSLMVSFLWRGLFSIPIVWLFMGPALGKDFLGPNSRGLKTNYIHQETSGYCIEILSLPRGEDKQIYLLGN